MVAQTSTVSPEIMLTDQQLHDSIRYLEQRLQDGYEKIDDGRASGRNVEHWEAVWFELLREYEELLDRLAA